MPVPVKVESRNHKVSEGYELGNFQTNLSEVIIEGPESELKRIAYAMAILDLDNVTTSVTATAPLRLYTAQGDEITNAYIKKSVESVTVYVPLYVTKEVPLVVNFKNGLLDSSNVKVNITPSTIKVKGSVETMRSVDRLVLPVLDEKKITADSMTVAITVPDNLINVSVVQEATISFRHVGTTTKDIVVSRDDIRVKNPNGLDYTILDEFITIRLRGPLASISMMTDENLTVTLDLSNYSEVSGQSNYALTVSVNGIYKRDVYELGEYKATVKIDP